HTVVALRVLRFLLDRDGPALFVELYDTESLRIVHVIAEYSGAGILFRSLHRCPQTFFQTMSVENIISQHHGNGVFSDELLPDDKCLCQSVRAWLYCIT